MLVPPLAVGMFQVIQRDLTLDFALRSQLVPPNPQRVCLLVWSRSGGSISISLRTDTPPGQGLPIGIDGHLEILWARHGALVSEAWYCVPAAGLNDVTVIEVVFRPQVS